MFARNAAIPAHAGWENARPAGRGIPWWRMLWRRNRRRPRPGRQPARPPDRDQQHSPADAGQHQHNRGGKQDRHRHQRAGPGAGRRRGDGKRGAAGRRPGAGKSTLLLQLCGAISSRFQVLYITGEESVRQVKLRADRLALRRKTFCWPAENDIDQICGLIERDKPDLVVIDSIQTMHTTDLTASTGQRLAGEGVRRPPAECSKKSGDPHLHCGPRE